MRLLFVLNLLTASPVESLLATPKVEAVKACIFSKNQVRNVLEIALPKRSWYENSVFTLRPPIWATYRA